MDTGVATVLVALLALAGTFLTVKYKKGFPAKKDRVELFFERYEDDRKADRQEIKDLKERVDSVEEDNRELRANLDTALRSLEDKDTKIRDLQKKVREESIRYQKLLKRFNALKLKYEKGAAEAQT